MKQSNTLLALAGILSIGAGASLLVGSTEAHAQSCPTGDTYLPSTGLCGSQAARLLPPLKKDFSDAAQMFGCKAVVNEASFLQGAILYWASSCKGQSAKLEARVKGMSAELWITNAHLGMEGIKPEKDAEYTAGLNIPPEQFATNSAQTWMQHFSNGAFTKAQIDKCRARPVAGEANIYVVDEFGPGEEPADSYRDACGQYGMWSGENVYWKLGRQDAWFFFPNGQDAMKSYDRDTLTFVRKNAVGHWMRDSNPAEMMNAALAVPDNYEVADVAGMPGAREALYGKARDYQVFSGSVDGVFKYCVGERRFGDYPFRIGFDGGQWQVAVPYSTKPDYYGSYEVDGKGRGMSGTSKNNWTFWWLGMPELDQLRNGSTLIMNIGRGSADFPLNGSAATITKVEECVHRQGRR